MTIQLILGHDEHVARWVQKQFPQIVSFGQCVAIGVARQDRLIAGVVYYNYHPHMIDASFAATDPRWCSRRILRAMFAYPFEQIKVRRLQVAVAKRDRRGRRMLKRVGFKPEGRRSAANPDGSDVIEYAMLRENCKWLKEQNHEPG